MNILAINANQLTIEFKLFRLHNKTKVNILLEGTIKRLDKNQVSVYIRQLGNDKEEIAQIENKSENFYHFGLDCLVNSPLVAKFNVDRILHHYIYGGELDKVVLLHPNTIADLETYNNYRSQQVTSIVVNICLQLFPHAKQYACFDNDFFNKYPEKSRTYALLAHKYNNTAYTFDGLKTYSICQKLDSIIEHKLAKGKYVVVNLDLYSSINSIKNFKPVFSEDIIYHEAEDIEILAQKITACILMHAVFLNGLDGIIFTGEYAIDNPKLREIIIDNLAFMGFILNKKSNNRNKIRLSDKEIDKKILLVSSDLPQALLDTYILHKVL